MAREHVFGVLLCTTHQIPFEDEPNCWCGVLHPPTLRDCAEPCPLWRGESTTMEVIPMSARRLIRVNNALAVDPDEVIAVLTSEDGTLILTASQSISVQEPHEDVLTMLGVPQ